MFVAESYKRRSDILGEKHLFRFHMDRLAVYQASEIITDQTVELFPPATQPQPPPGPAPTNQPSPRGPAQPTS